MSSINAAKFGLIRRLNTVLLVIALGLSACGRDPAEPPEYILNQAPAPVPIPNRPPVPIPRPKTKPTKPWHLFGENGINIVPAWEITRGNKGVNIAVIDSNFLPKNSAFTKGKCHSKAELIDFVGGVRKKGHHGAMVTSLINTCEDNPLKLLGINQNSRLLWLERSGKSGIGNELLQWAMGDPDICAKAKYISCPTTAVNLNPAHVINMSFGSTSERKDANIDRRILLPLVAKANLQGTILVASAGNEGQNADLHFPSSATGIISVGYTNSKGMADKSSNWGKTVEIMAPGSKIPVADSGGKSYQNGSSLAAPIVTGIISLMRSVYPALSWKTAVYFLQSTAVPMDCHAYCLAERVAKAQADCKKDCCIGNKQVCTPGRVDAGAAVAAAKKAATSGLPPVALVDSDKYWVGLKHDAAYTNWEGEFRLSNLGGAKGSYKINCADGGLTFDGKKELVVELAAKGERGDSVVITVIHPHEPLEFAWRESAILIASPDSGHVSTFSDEMVIYAAMYLSP